MLNEATGRIRDALESIEGVYNVDDTRPLPGIEWQIDVDRAEAARFGADITLVGNMIQLVTNGIKIGEYRPDDAEDEIDIRVRYPYDRPQYLTQIDELRIPTENGLVPISNFVKRVPANKVSTIQRTDMRRTMRVEADVLDGYLDMEHRAEMAEMMPYLDIDPTVWKSSFAAAARTRPRRRRFLSRAMLIAVAVMAIILVTQFNSLFQAFLILTAVVFSTGGVLLGSPHHGQAVRHGDERRRRDHAGRHRREQQHRVHRHLQRAAKRGADAYEAIFAPVRFACDRYC